MSKTKKDSADDILGVGAGEFVPEPPDDDEGDFVTEPPKIKLKTEEEKAVEAAVEAEVEAIIDETIEAVESDIREVDPDDYLAASFERPVDATVGEVTVARTYRISGIDEREESDAILTPVHRFVTKPAEVSVGLGATVNLKNYEFVRIDVRVTLPCYKEDVEAAYEEALKFANAKLGEQIEEAKNPKPSEEPFV